MKFRFRKFVKFFNQFYIVNLCVVIAVHYIYMYKYYMCCIYCLCKRINFNINNSNNFAYKIYKYAHIIYEYILYVHK